MSEEPKKTPGRVLVDRKLVEADSNIIAGRPMAALTQLFFSISFSTAGRPKAALLFCLLLVVLLARCIPVVSIVYICLIRILALRPPVLLTCSSAFGSLVILDVARCYLWLFTLYINIKIGKDSC